MAFVSGKPDPNSESKPETQAWERSGSGHLWDYCPQIWWLGGSRCLILSFFLSFLSPFRLYSLLHFWCSYHPFPLFKEHSFILMKRPCSFYQHPTVRPIFLPQRSYMWAPCKALLTSGDWSWEEESWNPSRTVGLCRLSQSCKSTCHLTVFVGKYSVTNALRGRDLTACQAVC